MTSFICWRNILTKRSGNIYTPRLLFARVKSKIENEGAIAFLKALFALFRYNLFYRKSYYLFRHKSTDVIPEERLHSVQASTFIIVSTNEEADKLALTTGTDFRQRFPHAREALDNGGIAFCIFVDKEIVHISWACVNGEVQKILGEPPLKVDFANNEALVGSLWTHPKYRRMGLAPYVTRKRNLYMRDLGKAALLGTIAIGNTSSLKVPTSGRSKIYAVGRHLKILCWESWKETPIDLKQESAK